MINNEVHILIYNNNNTTNNVCIRLISIITYLHKVLIIFLP